MPRCYEVRDSALHGTGLFAVRAIRESARVVEYVGELISHDEAAHRYDDDAMENHHTFLFTIDDDTVIDGGIDGNDAKYFNHSCDPNCETIEDDGRIFIEAIRDIPAGEELTYDYFLEREEPLPSHWRALYACLCGSPKCRGCLLDPDQPSVRNAMERETA
jgi:SET domain-containing protein